MQFPARMIGGQPSHLQHRGPGPSPLQVYSPAAGLMSVPAHQFQMPQSVPYMQVGYPLHPMAMMPSKPMSHVQYAPQPMFVDLQPVNIHQQSGPNQLVNPMPSPLAAKAPFQASASIDQQQQLQSGPSFDAPCRPPTASPSMTPQEKLEKLRRRQQMQARIAVEQQQQLLVSQSGGGMEPPTFHRQKQTSSPSMVPAQPGRLSAESSEGIRKPASDTEQRLLVPAGGAFAVAGSGDENEEDSSLEGSVLRQLEMTTSEVSEMPVSQQVGPVFCFLFKCCKCYKGFPCTVLFLQKG